MSGKQVDWRAELQAIGGWDNQLVGVPAGGVREIIIEVEALRAEVERLRMAEAEAMAVVYSLEGTVERLRAALEEIRAAYPTTDDDAEQVAHYIANEALRTSPSPGTGKGE